MNPLARVVLGVGPLLLGALAACSSGSPATPPDAGLGGTATSPLVTAIPADAAADAPLDAAFDASTDSGPDPDGGATDRGAPPKPRPFTEAHQACCAPRAEKHVALETDCAGGKLERCAEAAADYKSGCGAPLDPDRARALMDKGCALGHEPTCTAQLAEGVGPESDNETLRNLCARTHVTGCYELAGAMNRWESPEHVLNMYKAACDGGDARGCFALAEQQPQLAERAKIPALERKPLEGLLVRGCTLDPLECHRHVQSGVGIPGSSDNKDIVALLLPVILAGHEKRCETQCDCPNGDLVFWTASTEPERSRRYAEKACSMNRDCLPLADLLERGVGGPADLPRAVSIYEPLCPTDSTACDHLAAMSEEGRGKDKDPVAARKRAEDACPLVKDFVYPSGNILPQSRVYGTLASCARVARYREEGFGGPKDPRGAYQVYYYYCGTAEGVSLCKKRIALGRSLGLP